MARRFFAKSSDIKNDTVILQGQEAFHISKVLRLQVDDEILISTDNAEELKCSIQKINKENVLCEIMDRKKIAYSCQTVTLFQALMKGEHMDLVVQKATELNVQKLVPFISKYVVVKPDDKKQERFERISIEACKQSNRAVPMQISEVLDFKKLLETLKSYSQIILAYENADAPAKEILQKLDAKKSLALIVGSEGGFSEEEVGQIKQVGGKIISMGQNILRGETASLALVSAVMYELGEWKK